MSNELISKDEITNELVNEIKELIINARNKVAQQVNETLYRKRFYVCWLTTKNYNRKYSLLCRYGILQ